MTVEPLEPERNACRPVGKPGAVEFIWTVADGRGIFHDHDADGCPFEPGGIWAGQAEEVAAETAGEACPDCGQVHR